MRVIVFMSDVNLIHKTFVCLRRFLLVDTGLPDHHCTFLLSGHGINFTYMETRKFLCVILVFKLFFLGIPLVC